MRGSRHIPGELRRSQNWIGRAGGTPAEATFVPPPPIEVPGALGALEAFLHTKDDLPLLIKIGLAHAQFQLVQKLEEMGVLKEITGQKRNRRFRYDAYVRLFDENPKT